MKIGPKYKIARRLGAPVFEKTQTQKYALSESRKAKAMGGRRKRVSDYGLQLIEKQKARYSYALSEKVFSRNVRNAIEQKQKKPSEALFESLERRLDTIVTRAGFGPTRFFCRQLISHGHILVNGRRVTVPSYYVKDGDVIQVKKKSLEKELFKGHEVAKDSQTVSWITVDPKEMKITVKGTPARAELDLLFDIDSVLEFYSR